MNQKQFFDEYSQRHIINHDKPLGRGGQGIVYSTNVPDIAVKLALDKDGSPLNSPEEIDCFNQKIYNIRRLPVPSDCHIAIPLATLRDNAGYVMSLMNDMQSLASIWPLSNNGTEILKQYNDTGGIRRRLRLLGEAANILSQLHGSGLVYGDVSPSNIFISSDTNYHEVWFIDADNLCFHGSARQNIFTPKYGAPEVVNGISVCTADSDIFSFAVTAFYVLSLNHPFCGKLIEGTDDGWDADSSLEITPEERAYAGELPYIADPLDDSNTTTNGFPVELFCTPELAKLFEYTFSKEGRENPAARPPSFLWPRVLLNAAEEIAYDS